MVNVAGVGNAGDARDWVRSVGAAMRPYAAAAGSYINGSSEFDAVVDAYGAAKLPRLVELKATYDPTDLVHGNARVTPVG